MQTQMLKKVVLCFASVALVFAHETARAGVLMQGFYWDAPSDWDKTWWNHLASKSEELSQHGFTALWLPPALKSAGGGYSVGYDPFDDYDLGTKDERGTIGTRWGNKQQLVRAIARLRASGLEVYGDFVLAHRNGDDGRKQFFYRNALGAERGGRFEKNWTDFSDGNSLFGRQLNHYNDRTRGELTAAGMWQIETLGLDGIRIDHAKGIPGFFLNSYLRAPIINDRLSILEYWDENVDALSAFLHNDLGGRSKAFDFPLWGLLRQMANGSGYFDMRRLQGAGLAGRDPFNAVTFAENHDTDVNYPTVKNKAMSYAYILTAEGYPSVFWKDYYVYGLKDRIDRLVWIHERLADGGTIYRWADEDFLVYERQGRKKLLVGLNDNGMSDRTGYVQTNFGARVRLTDYTGQHGDLTTDDRGGVNLTVHAASYAAYAPTGEKAGVFALPSLSVRQTFTGADDLDIPSANPETFSKIETLNIAKTNESANWQFEGVGLGCDERARVELRLVPLKKSGGDADGAITLFNHDMASLCGGALPRGQFTVPADGDYRAEVRVRAPSKARKQFKWTVQYRAPRG